MIYFIVEESDYNLVKIGTTNNLRQRISNLQTGNSKNLKIIAVIDGDIAVEHLLHNQFKKYAVNREWFRLERDLFEFIKPHLLSYISPKPMEEEDIFLGVVENYLKSRTRTTIADILINCFTAYNADLTNKQLQYRISEILKQLNWKKKRSGNIRYWSKT